MAVSACASSRSACAAGSPLPRTRGPPGPSISSSSWPASASTSICFFTWASSPAREAQAVCAWVTRCLSSSGGTPAPPSPREACRLAIILEYDEMVSSSCALTDAISFCCLSSSPLLTVDCSNASRSWEDPPWTSPFKSMIELRSLVGALPGSLGSWCICCRTNDVATNRRAWKARTAKAIRSRDVRDSADRWKTREGLSSRSKRTVSLGVINTRG
mmetsp:Transcript_82553/g.220664  ORF Transcript_82553/g.220664 Transcript_82553/m.220664 type:complete len:216 (-) Transcript_82553:288-935(-)